MPRPRLSNDSDLDAIGHEVYGEPPAPSPKEQCARSKSVKAIISRMRKREADRCRPAPLLEEIDGEDAR